MGRRWVLAGSSQSLLFLSSSIRAPLLHSIVRFKKNEKLSLKMATVAVDKIHHDSRFEGKKKEKKYMCGFFFSESNLSCRHRDITRLIHEVAVVGGGKEGPVIQGSRMVSGTRCPAQRPVLWKS